MSSCGGTWQLCFAMATLYHYNYLFIGSHYIIMGLHDNYVFPVVIVKLLEDIFWTLTIVL